MKKRVFIVHGWGAAPDENWFAWVKRELEDYEFEVVVPEMPNTFLPKQESWLAHLQEVVGEVDEDTFLIGHSLGVITILRFLENLPQGKKIGGAILVSGFSKSIHIQVIENFTESEVDFAKIKNSCNAFAVFHSDDDLVVPLERAITLHDQLDGNLMIIDKGGHLNEGSGNFQFPELIEELLRIAR